jgi:DNA-binding response OmpR family regulator
VVDRKRGSVESGQASTVLSPQELRVFDCLLRNRGTPVSRRTMFDEIWPKERAAPSSRNLPDVYVFYLRRKLAAIGAGGLVKTVRGRGYLIDL